MAPARAPFVALVLVVLSLGLGVLLLLNTLLAQGSFTLHALEGQVADLADREQELQQRAAELASPQRLSRRAAALGMVPSENPAFLRAEDGKVLGEPVPAADRPTVVGSADATGSEQNEQGGQPEGARSDQAGGATSQGRQAGESKQDDEGNPTDQDNQNSQGDGGTDR